MTEHGSFVVFEIGSVRSSKGRAAFLENVVHLPTRFISDLALMAVMEQAVLDSLDITDRIFK
mgnify:CR=1 FL=1